MFSNPVLLVLVLTYIVICGFILYFCVFADPEISDVAYLVQVALPNKVRSSLTKAVGEKKMNVLQSILDYSMVFLYLVVVLGCWSVVFWYIYPWITDSPRVSNIHKVLGYFVFVACIGSWVLAHKSSPGIITARTFKKYDHYPYDNLLFLPNKRCGTTNLIRIPRSKFDRYKYNQNVPRYDHFCGWVYNTIGENNYRWFLLFLVVHVLMCAYGSAVTITLFYSEIQDKKLLELTFFDRATGDHIQSNWNIVFQYLFSRNTLEFSVLLIMFVIGIALGAFLGYHIYITSLNQTTNEAGKWSDINQWYKSQKKKYNEALKKGLVSPEKTAELTEAPDLRDNDVTCTGASKQQSQQEPSGQEQNYFDPGPVPKNIYDRGFIENWKEVLFPMSQRKDVMKLGGYSRRRPQPDKLKLAESSHSAAQQSAQNKSKAT